MPCGSSTGSPSSTMLPRSGLIRRIKSRATVDLPQPDSPTTPRVSPLATDSVRSSTARTTLRPRPKMPPPTGKCLRRPVASRRGWAGPPRSTGITVSMSGLHIHGGTQAVAHQVETDRGDEDHDAGERRQDRIDVDRLAQRVQHQAPFRLGWLHAETE